MSDENKDFSSPKLTHILGLSSKEQYAIFRSLGDLLFIKDSDLKIVDANDAFLELYPPEKRARVIGFTTFEDYSDDQMRDFTAEDRRALEEGFSEVQETIDFPDGRRRTLLTRKVGVTGPDGKRYVFGSSRDITDVIKTETSLKIVNAELEEFSYRVSHDLKSPLISTIKLLTLAQEAVGNGDIDQASKLIDLSLSSTRNLETLAEDILVLHRLKRADMDWQEIDIEASILKSWNRHAVDVPLKLVTSIGLAEPFFCDQRAISTVLENLLSNCVKYRNPEASNDIVHVAVTSDRQWVHVSVSDSGIGIPLDKRDRLFGMFQRFHPRTATGTGLGLYMVRQWVERLNGNISVKHLNPGTCFKIQIPQRTQLEHQKGT